MYEEVINGLCECLNQIRRVVISELIDPDSTVGHLLNSFKKKIDIIFFLTDFQKKDFVREWCDQHEKEADLIIVMSKDVARLLTVFVADHGDQSEVVTYDEIRANLFVATDLLGQMISDIKG